MSWIRAGGSGLGGGLLADIILTGGDVIIAIALTLLETAALWIPAFAYIERLFGRLGLDATTVEWLLYAAIAIAAVYYVYRAGRATINNFRQQT